MPPQIRCSPRTTRARNDLWLPAAQCRSRQRPALLPVMVKLHLLGLWARRHNVDHRHLTKVGIVRIIEPIGADEGFEIIDIRLPALGVLNQRVGEDNSRDAQTLPPQVGPLQAEVAISPRGVQVEGIRVGGLRSGARRAVSSFARARSSRISSLMRSTMGAMRRKNSFFLSATVSSFALRSRQVSGTSSR